MSARQVMLGTAAALALAAAGCGSSSSTSTSAATSAATPTAAAQGARGPSPAQIQARVDLAKCARAHGINLPDPGANGTYQAGTLANVLTQYGQTKVNEVEQACRQYLVAAFPNLALTPAQREQRTQALFRFAACMRSHGVPGFPDPTAGRVGIKPGEINPSSPAFKSAVTSCRSLVPPRAQPG